MVIQAFKSCIIQNMKLEVFLMNKRKELIKELIKEFDLKDTNDISSMFRELMGDTIQEMASLKKV